MPTHKLLPSWQNRRRRCRLRPHQNSAHRHGPSARANRSLKSLRHRYRSFAISDRHDFSEIMQFRKQRKNRVAIQSTRDRRRNIDRRQSLLQDPPRRRFGIALRHVYRDPTASLFSAFAGVCPAKNSATPFAATTIIRVRVSTVALPMCGVRITSRRASSFG